jgi:hypothetical protein
MLDFVLGKSRDRTLREFVRGWSSDRKLRLFGVACCRRVQPLLSEGASKLAVEVAERFADGFASVNDLAAVEGDSLDAAYEGSEGSDERAIHAAACAYAVTLRAAKNAAMACDEARQASADDVAESAIQSSLLRDIFGNPFRPVTIHSAWITSTVTSLAQAIYTDRAFDRLPILADALEDAGCTNQDILEHCRQPGEHVRGCWVVDLLVGK